MDWDFVRGVLRTPKDPSWRKVPLEAVVEPEARELYAEILRHVEKHGTVPSLGLLEGLGHQIPEGDTESSDPLSSVCEALKTRLLYTDLSVAVEKTVVAMREGPTEALELLADTVATIQLKHSAADDLEASSFADAVAERYERTRDTEGVLGIPWPWEHYNQATRGIRPGQYVVLYGRAKTYKTWLLLSIAHRAYQEGNTVVFGTREMLPEDVQDMLACLVAKISWEGFYNGNLSRHEEERLKEALSLMRESPPFPIVTLRQNGVAAVAEFEAKIRHYGAQAAFFDGVYLLAEDGEWTSISQINKAFKQTALRSRVPIVGVTQENRQGVVGYTSFEQDCDALLRVSRTPEQAQQSEVQIDAPFMRKAMVHPIIVHARPAYNFNEKRVVLPSSSEALKGAEEDDNVMEE